MQNVAPHGDRSVDVWLYGFERDINKLIDAFALQATQDRCTSFQTFKRLFQLACGAYLHQAYPGCQHSPEYVQLLYTTALERLDVPSPIASQDSPLWMLHGASADMSAPAAAAAAAAAGTMTGATMVPNTGVQLQDAHLLQHTGTLGQDLWPSPAAQDVADPAMLQQQQLPMQAQPSFAGQSQLHLVLQEQQSQARPQCLQALPELPRQPHHQHQQQLLPQVLLADYPLPDMQWQHEQFHSRTGDHQPAVHQSGQIGNVTNLPFVTTAADELEDDFLDDLLAIFDEAEAGQQVHTSCATVQQVTAAATEPSIPEARQHQQQQHQQQQPAAPSCVIPLAVKAAAVFMLHCLFETQLVRPCVCIYVSHSSLRALQSVAAECRAVGPAAVDVLLVLQSLLVQQRLLVGQFRRPRVWQPQLPQYLKPPDHANAGYSGLGSAAANKAMARSSMNKWRVKAVTAAARAARSLVRKVNAHYRQDTPEHREALFHIKSTLSGLSNFKALVGRCANYADARRAIFEPLLALKETIDRQPAVASAASKEQQHGTNDQQEEWWHKPRRVSKAKQRAAAKRQKSETQPAVVAAPAAIKPAWEGALLKWTAAGNGSVGVPELFDRSFGADLQRLATEEAARMLVQLDPAYDASNLRKHRKQQQEPSGLPAAPAAGQQSGKKQVVQVAGEIWRWRGGYLDDLAAAGVVQPSELQHLQQQLGRDSEVTKAVGMAVPQQVLQLQVQRQQRAMHVAEEWFTAQDALMAHECDDGEDMP